MNNQKIFSTYSNVVFNFCKGTYVRSEMIKVEKVLVVSLKTYQSQFTGSIQYDTNAELF